MTDAFNTAELIMSTFVRFRYPHYLVGAQPNTAGIKVLQ